MEEISYYQFYDSLRSMLRFVTSIEIIWMALLSIFFFFVLPAGWLLDRETRCFDEVCGTGQLQFGPVQFLGKSAIGWPNLSPQI